MIPKDLLLHRIIPEESAPDGDPDYETILQEHLRSTSAEPLRELIALMRPADEVWTYSTDAESWRHHEGRMGYALVRQDEVVAERVVLMN
jgi:hypothetical protein